MLEIGEKALIFLAAFGGMELFALSVHRHLMHGALWFMHRSHHEKHEGWFELNDLFAVIFALPAIVCIWLGVNASSWWLPVGLGMTAYGGVYFLFHDGMIHRRFHMPFKQVRGFWLKRLQAHRLHHAVRTKEGCVSFGLLYARSARELKAELSSLRSARPDAVPALSGSDR